MGFNPQGGLGMLRNIILNTDSYKYSHWLQYPKGTEIVHSYIESRGGKWDRTVFFGLQMFIKEYLEQPITAEMIDEAEEIVLAHGLPFNREGWEYILDKHGGYLPIRISAVPEGTVVPVKNVLATVENTDPKCFWLTSFIETAILRAIWYPTTVATLSWSCRNVIREAFLETSNEEDVNAQLPFKLHDFGARGVSSQESAAIGGLAHLVNFMGSDTISAVVAARRYYSAPMAAFSIPAAEHSTMTSWGRDGESDAYRNMLEQFAKPGALLAVVSDSYDLFNAVDNIWGEELRPIIVDSGAMVVVRPDSGDPTTIPVETIERLGRKFGYTVNEKGFKVLNHVRVIQGDGINPDSLKIILENLVKAGWAVDNLAFGMGGGLLQQVDRDTQKFAMKASAIRINGVWKDVYKDPITDRGKTSKRGRLGLVRKDGVLETVRLEGQIYFANLLRTVYENGAVVEDDFSSIRARAFV